jgi:hypothetical protein
VNTKRQSRILLLSAALWLPLFITACQEEPDFVAVGLPTPTVDSEPLSLEPEEPDADPEDDVEPAKSAKKPRGPLGDPTGLAACCSALHQNAKLGGPNAANYDMAAKMCDGLRKDPNSRKALVQVRKLLSDAKVPSKCV